MNIAGAPALRAQGLTRRWWRATAVNDVSFEVYPGQIVALVGPNGAGKTTTLRMLAGVLRPTSGDSDVLGHAMSRAPMACKQRIAFVPHDPSLFDALTVGEHLALAADLWGVPDPQPRIQREVTRFALGGMVDVLAGELSRGQQQRVALAAAAVHDPAVLLLDEPMTGLDPGAIRIMKAWLRDEAARGTAILLSSHLLDVVDDLCTDLLVLVGGAVRYRGPVAQAKRELQGGDLEELFFKITADAP